MGLDSVELIIATEDEFGIVIEDAEAEHITTPRMLADYVISKLDQMRRADKHCLSQATFHKIRSVLVKQFGWKRKDVRLDSPIRQFLTGDIRTQWRQFRTEINATQLPELQCTKRVLYSMTVGLPLACIFAALILGVSIFGTILMVLALSICSILLMDKIANQIPAHVATVRGIVPYVGISERKDWTAEYVLKRVIQITSFQLGVPIEKIQPDSNFVEDLGMS